MLSNVVLPRNLNVTHEKKKQIKNQFNLIINMAWTVWGFEEFYLKNRKLIT